jgi:hypothetical protein
MSNEEIESICNKYGIIDYTINDGVVDVNGDVYLIDREFTELPIRFGQVTGDFYCHNNKLTSLIGSPKSVGGDFECYYNQLTKLEGSPQIVGDSFDCADNQLTDLNGSPSSVGGSFVCDGNQVTDLTGIPDSIGADFYCADNPIGSIFNEVGQDFLEAFKIYKVIKDGQVNLKRLKYVMSLFNESIDLEDIKKHYTIL